MLPMERRAPSPAPLKRQAFTLEAKFAARPTEPLPDQEQIRLWLPSGATRALRDYVCGLGVDKRVQARRPRLKPHRPLALNGTPEGVP